MGSGGHAPQRHLHAGGLLETENRLASESSPYLLQHRNNPVDWYPWGEEAFGAAGARDRPVFLSIGYATCHWCHVMERESFEDERVADLLNADFVSIKVDREERPDIDQIYMTVCQIAGGHCGWPLTVLLTPDKRPFFVATYIPRESRHGRTGLLELLPRVAELWRTDRSGILASAGEITDALLETQMGGAAFSPAILDAAVTQFEQRFDSHHGGFSSAPKFPTAHNLLFLMERATRGSTPGDTPGDTPERLPPMVSHTLDRMRRGGIFDHVGFGFHRYSTDREWKLPHFEKMLYDQAMLCLAYAEGFGRSGDENLARTARRVAAYVGRVLTADDGAFYSAEDADSEGEEGRFYVWTLPELVDVLGRERARLVSEIFGVRPEGNFADEATGETSGQNVLHSIAEDEVLRENTRAILFAHRENRPHPLLDDKILVDWNGLMIASLARAGFVLDDATLIEQSARAASWILDVMEDDGLLMHRYRGGEVGIRGMLDDYAFFTWGLTELYLATWDATWLEHAIRVAQTQIQLFLDTDNGDFFLTDREAPVVLHRPKELADGALPAGNSISILNYARLFALTGEPRFEEVARGALDAAATLVGRYPSAFGACLFAAEVALGPSTEIVVVGEPGTPEVDEMLRVVRRHSESRRTVSMLVDTANGDRIRRLAPFTSSMTSAGAATAYVCSGFVCDLPVTSAAELEAKLHRG